MVEQMETFAKDSAHTVASTIQKGASILKDEGLYAKDAAEALKEQVIDKTEHFKDAIKDRVFGTDAKLDSQEVKEQVKTKSKEAIGTVKDHLQQLKEKAKGTMSEKLKGANDIGNNQADKLKKGVVEERKSKQGSESVQTKAPEQTRDKETSAAKDTFDNNPNEKLKQTASQWNNPS
jgi:hypothetical protein